MPTKYAIRDPTFYSKMRAAAWNEEVTGMLVILEHTGMHVSSLCELSPKSLLRRGDDNVLEWKRPKTNKTLNRSIPADDVGWVRAFLAKKRKSRQHYHRIIKEVGKRAGYDGVSPMTYRHQRCLFLLRNGYEIWVVPQIMGCTFDVVLNNYAKLKEWGEIT